MTTSKPLNAFLLLCAMAWPTLAQETTETEAPADTETATEAPAEENDGPGSVYVKSEHNDWDIRCVRGGIGQDDICQMFQLLYDTADNPVSEIRIGLAPNAQERVAIAQVLVPLEVFLAPGIEVAIDGTAAGRVPYVLCDPQNCLAEFPLRDNEVRAFKRGNEATLKVVARGNQPVEISVPVSLNGFTAAYDTLSAGE